MRRGLVVAAIVGALALAALGWFVLYRSPLELPSPATPTTSREAPKATLAAPPSMSAPPAAVKREAPASLPPTPAAKKPDPAAAPRLEWSGDAGASPGRGTEGLRPVLRTGARLVAAVRDQAYYVECAPRPDLAWPRLRRAASGKSFGFEVFIFDDHSSVMAAGSFAVERAGEIVAVAVARQLEAMGFPVGIDLGQALKPTRDELGERFKVDLGRLARRASISGMVNFIVKHTAPEGRFATRADLVVVVGLGDASGQRLYDRRVSTSATVVGERLDGASQRARKTAGDALQKFLAAFVGDAKLEEVLVAYAGAAPKS